MDTIFLKLLSPFLLLMTVIVQYGLEYRWKDKRTKANKRVRKILLLLTVIFVLTTSATVFVDSQTNKKLKGDIEDIKGRTSGEILNAKKREDAAIQQRNVMQQKLTKLGLKIETLVNTARRFKPNLTEEEALEYISKKADYAIEMSTRDIPKNSSVEVSEKLLNSLKKWHKENINVELELYLCNAAQKNTDKALGILVHELKRAGINPKVSFSMMGIFPTGFCVEYPKELEVSAKNLLGILSKKFMGDVRFSKHPKKNILIHVNGFPEFLSDGKIIYK